MKKRFLLSILPVLLFAQSNPDREDMEALKRWIQDKRLITMKEIGGDLSLSGDVRTEFQKTSEMIDGNEIRGNGAPRPMYAWDVEFNLMLDYRTDRTWAAIKLEYDNDMGQRSGTTNKIRLEKAYLGGRIVAGDTFTFDAEIGRRFLNNVFDSKLQFASRYDGLLLKFSKAFESVGDYYTNVGAFLINDRTNHYGFVTEMGLLQIANMGLNIKYSIIDWHRPGGERTAGQTAQETALIDLRYQYLVSQASISYQYYPEWIGKKLLKFYGAVLTNHLAERDPLKKAGVTGQAFGKKNWGWYVGTSIGQVKKEHDWSIDTNFQWAKAQCVPSFDLGGIGRGNSEDTGLYSTRGNVTGDPGDPLTKKTATGKMNYYGFTIDGLYAFTSNLTINPNIRYSWTLNKNLGPNLVYSQYELELIYAF